MKRISGFLKPSISCVLVIALTSQLSVSVAATNQVDYTADNDSGQITAYYYQGGNISVARNKSENNSFILVNHQRLVALQNTASAKALSGASAVSYYLGDNKNQDMLVGQSAISGQTLGEDQPQTTDYRGYGQRSQVVAGSSVSSFGYNGECQDPTTNLTYLRARDYQSDSQRFISMDSYHVWNKYNFADKDPINNIDPSGHLSMPKVSKGAALGGVFFLFNIVSMFLPKDKPTQSAIISGIFTAVTFAGLFWTVPELMAAASGEAAEGVMAVEEVGNVVPVVAGKVSASRVVSAGLSVVADAGAMVSSGASLYAQVSYMKGSSSPESIAKMSKVAEISQWVSLGAVGGMALKGLGGMAARGAKAAANWFVDDAHVQPAGPELTQGELDDMFWNDDYSLYFASNSKIESSYSDGYGLHDSGFYVKE